MKIEDTAAVVSDFSVNLDQYFEAATLVQRKELIRRCVKEIRVEHSTRTVRCFVRKLPAITPVLVQAYSGREEKQTATSKKSPFINAGVAGTGCRQRAAALRGGAFAPLLSLNILPPITP